MRGAFSRGAGENVDVVQEKSPEGAAELLFTEG